MQGSMEEDCVALRRLRSDDASGALKEYFGQCPLNDNARGIDRFGYRGYAKGLHEIIDTAAAEPPVCVGLYAKWGSGKTFIINCIKQEFDPGKMYGVEEDLTTHDMRQWFERDIATPEDADAAEDMERMDEMSY